MSSCAPVTTPMEPSMRFSKDDCPVSKAELQDMSKVPYRGLIGSLMYLMVLSRPDLAYPVGILSKFMFNPGRKQWEGARRVLKCLQGMKGYRLTFQDDGKGVKLMGFL